MTRIPHRTPLALVAGLGLLVAGLAALGGPASAVGRVHRDTVTYQAHNPLAAHPWGLYRGSADDAWTAYEKATAKQQARLDTIVQQPRVQWFGRWIPDGDIADKIHRFVAIATGGDPDVLVQLAIFRMDPWEGNACTSLPTDAQQASYKRWVRRAAQAIGDTHAALVLQPDGPFALCAPGGSKLPSHLLRFAARRFSANPNTAVYLDAGAADWNRSDPRKALKILLPAGIADVRGFALGSTHYDATMDEVTYGAAVVRALAKRGITGKHFVVNTAANGRPFAGYTYRGPDFDNARVCTVKVSDPCVSLGIPPTTQVADPAWGLPAAVAAKAATLCDAYVWIGRPWFYRQAAPFAMKRALQLARNAPYA
ncbi:MAG: glycoside hydrolase family 6 protein, partial [Nocardioides sp.]